MNTVTLNEFKTMLARPEIKPGKKLQYVKTNMEGLFGGKVAQIPLKYDTGGYWLAVAVLAKQYKTVKALLIGKNISLIYVK